MKGSSENDDSPTKKFSYVFEGWKVVFIAPICYALLLGGFMAARAGLSLPVVAICAPLPCLLLFAPFARRAVCRKSGE